MHEEFIKDLASKGAKRPQCQPNKLLLAWFSAMVLYATLVFLFLGIREDLSDKVSDLFFYFELFLIISVSISAAVAVNFLALPDVNQKRLVILFPIIFLALLLAVIISQYIQQRGLEIHALCDLENHRCFLAIIFFSVVPCLIFLIILYRAATLNSVAAGCMAGLSGGSFSYLLLRLIHPTEDVFHLFFWHFTPILLVMMVSVIAVKLLSKRI